MEDKKIPDVIELNVGGKLLTTLLSTLTKDPDSMRAAMFSGRHVMSKDKDGRYFIDCDGNVFQYILDFLRFGTLPPPDIAVKVYDLSKYFGIQLLSAKVETYNTVTYRKRINEFKTSFDAQQYEMLKVKTINMMYTCNAKPEDNKVLHILCKSESCRPFEFNCHTNYSSIVYNGGAIYLEKMKPNYKTITVLTNLSITEEIKMCLAYDLCKLGFGVDSKTEVYEDTTNRPSTCIYDQHCRCHVMVLLAKDNSHVTYKNI